LLLCSLAKSPFRLARSALGLVRFIGRTNPGTFEPLFDLQEGVAFFGHGDAGMAELRLHHFQGPCVFLEQPAAVGAPQIVPA
jgi:hypothetical protein